MQLIAPQSPEKAKELIFSLHPPSSLRVDGHLKLAYLDSLTELPEELIAASLDLTDCKALRKLPAKLQVNRLNLSGCVSLRQLPAGLKLFDLILKNTRIRSLPDDLQVENRLDLEGCDRLEALPANLSVGTLMLRNCINLRSLPEGLNTCFLDITNCINLTEWPENVRLQFGRLIAAGCVQLRSLPPILSELSQVDINGCVNISRLPENVSINSWLDIANTAIWSLPPALENVHLRWRGVPINKRIAFQPETITINEILNEPNVELRRVLLERMGYEQFLSEANAELLDMDFDAGGERRLLRVEFEEDEPLICIAVICPSTNRQYMLRVPPTITTCREAAAWLAGFDDPDDYSPIIET
ncbi:MAG: DUF6745 domain-containing protein [Acidobacteriota bacterium]